MTKDPNEIRLREVRNAWHSKRGTDRDDTLTDILDDAVGDGLELAAELTRKSEPVHSASCDCSVCRMRLELIEEFQKAARRVRG